jgi:hypothetical protein
MGKANKKRAKQGVITPALRKLINAITIKEPDFLLRACGHYLSNWPEKMSAKRIVERLEAGSVKGIDLWQPFEDHAPEAVAEYITDMAYAMERYYIEDTEPFRNR